MRWHFWKCKQMLWLWISTGWGLKPIHPLKSHCTKAFKFYTIQGDKTAQLFFFWFPLVSSDLYDLCTSLLPQPPIFYTYINLSFHILSQSGFPWKKKEGNLQHRRQVTKNSNYVLQWSKTDETGAAVALKPQDTPIHTVQHIEKMTETHFCARSQRHIRIQTTVTIAHASCSFSCSVIERNKISFTYALTGNEM